MVAHFRVLTSIDLLSYELINYLQFEDTVISI